MKYCKRAEKAWKARLAGMTVEQIGELLGIQTKSVYCYLSVSERHHRPVLCEKCGLSDDERGLDRMNDNSPWLCSRCMCPDEELHAYPWRRTE